MYKGKILNENEIRNKTFEQIANNDSINNNSIDILAYEGDDIEHEDKTNCENIIKKENINQDKEENEQKQVFNIQDLE